MPMRIKGRKSNSFNARFDYNLCLYFSVSHQTISVYVNVYDITRGKCNAKQHGNE